MPLYIDPDEVFEIVATLREQLYIGRARNRQSTTAIVRDRPRRPSRGSPPCRASSASCR